MTAILEPEGIVDEEQDRDPLGEKTLHSFASTSVIDTHRTPHPRCHSRTSRIPRTFSIIDVSDDESARFGRRDGIGKFQARHEGRFGSLAPEPQTSIVNARTAFNRQYSSENRLDSRTGVAKGRNSFETIISD